ncbi:MAG: FAD-dependent oxidoreductase [Alphaproteobacteria bacterium]
MGNSADRSVVIVGSGPGGVYVAQALLEKAPGCRIDIIDRLPTPFGLVRGGVAPDHQHTKRVDRKYSTTVSTEGVRFLGNVELGRDVSLDELTEIYDSVVLAYGAPFDNRLGIPGEDKAGVYGSNAFVGWYNCHPDFRTLDPDLDVEGAVVIGIGNVAIDAARVLSRTPGEMATTDIADYAIDRIDASPLENVHMFGRRGPIEASFTNTELKELGALENATTDVDPAQIPDEAPDTMEGAELRARTRILGTLRDFGAVPAEAKRRAIHIRFYASPVEILGGEKVEGVRMERTRVENGRCIGTGETFDVPCGLVVTCIGSRAEAVAGVPFDEARGIAQHQDGVVQPRVYAVGWLKRGASGTIGTNRLDSYDVTERLIADFDGPARLGPDGLNALIAERDLNTVSFDDWLTINRLEEEAADEAAPRRKFTKVSDMLDALEKARANA